MPDMDQRKFFGAVIAALTIIATGAQAAPMVSIGQGTNVWRTYSCAAAPPGHGHRGAIIATAADGPQVADWIALMKSEEWGYQPPVWPDCADVLAQCNGQATGEKSVQTFRAGDVTPPEPNGSTYPAQRWTTRVTIQC